MALNNPTHDIRKNAFDSRGKAFVKEVVKSMATRYVEMLSKLKKHYPDIDFGEVEATLHSLMEDTQNSLERYVLKTFARFNLCEYYATLEDKGVTVKIPDNWPSWRPSGEPAEDLRAHTLELLVSHAGELKALVDSKRRALEAQRKHLEAQARSLQDALIRVRALRTALVNSAVNATARPIVLETCRSSDLASNEGNAANSR